MLRLFIAVNLPANIKEELHQLQRQLYVVCPDIKWVDANNFHITIKFLGETDQQQLTAIKKALRQSVIGTHPFELNVSKLGTFPERGTPRVVWAGLGGNINGLMALYSQVERQLVSIGFTPEKRKFSPHLTLGRVKSNNPSEELQRAITNLKVSEDTFKITSIELMQSDLTRTGPIYSPLASYGFV